MKIIEGFKMRKLGREYIVVPESTGLVNFNKMISFNETAAFLWESVAGMDFSVDDLTQMLVGKYEVDEQTAAADAARLAQSWEEAGLISK